MKKLLVLALCLALSVGGVYAYVEGTLALEAREAATNTITQSILQRNGDTYVAAQKTSLYPAHHAVDVNWNAADSQGFWPADMVNGARDNIVQVTNNASSACFFRTYIAFENNGGVFDDFIMVNWHDSVGTSDQFPYMLETLPSNVVINGEPYRVFVLTYTKPLAAGATSEPSLLQLAMMCTAGNNEVALLGPTYNVLACTEAVWQDTQIAAEAPVISDYKALDALMGDPAKGLSQSVITQLTSELNKK